MRLIKGLRFRLGMLGDASKVGCSSPEDLLAVGFERSRVVMANEAHSGLKRCIRTRLIGKRLVEKAHDLGVRHLAMEALGQPGAFDLAAGAPDIGYLAQPDMKALIQSTLALGWTVHGYEANQEQAPETFRADTMGMPFTNWREEEQARNLLSLVRSLDSLDRLLVWCGNGHASKDRGGWTPMGWHFRNLSGIDPFVLDQTVTVRFEVSTPWAANLIEWARPHLARRGGTAGFLREGSPLEWRSTADAYLLSLDNELE